MLASRVDHSKSVPDDVLLDHLFDSLDNGDLMHLAQVNVRFHTLLMNQYHLSLKHILPLRLELLRTGFHALSQFDSLSIMDATDLQTETRYFVYLPWIGSVVVPLLTPSAGMKDFSIVALASCFYLLMLYLLKKANPTANQTLKEYLEKRRANDQYRKQIWKVLDARQRQLGRTFFGRCCKKTISPNLCISDFILMLRDYVKEEVGQITEAITHNLDYFEAKQSTTLSASLNLWQDMKTSFQKNHAFERDLGDLVGSVNRCFTSLNSAHEKYNVKCKVSSHETTLVPIQAVSSSSSTSSLSRSLHGGE